MPIRIRPDSNQESYTPRSGGGSGGGGGIGSLLQFIPLLLGLFGRNPKMLIVLIIVGGLWYFMGGKGCSSASSASSSNALSTGALLDPKKYGETEIYEPLADNKRNPLPESVSLLQFAPDRLNQGEQGSCVAWASAYAARSIMEARESGKSGNESRFSPAFLYNQIHLEGCQGAYLPEALKLMQEKGLAPFDAMPYDDRDCEQSPNQMALRAANDFKIDGYQRLSGGADGTSTDEVNMVAIKQNLAQGAPVVIGMMVGGSFMQDMMGQETWRPTDADYEMRNFGGHAMCVIGYDDYKFARNMGGFQIMNSWGKDWGNKGIAWVSYDDFRIFVREAYGIYPGGNAEAPQTSVLNAQLGIVLKANDQNLPVVNTSSWKVTTSRKMAAEEEFKLQVTNNIPCYVYIFGFETDGSSYTLFPYTTKHSPFFGIKGTRLFPRDQSFYPDNVGSADYFAVVVSKDPLDYEEFNKKLSATKGSNYEERILSLTNGNRGFSVKNNSVLEVSGDLKSAPIAGFVVEVLK